MGFLVRRDEVTSDPLRLPSRSPIPRALRAKTEMAIGEERARILVQLTRMQGVGQVGDAAIAVTTFITDRAEAAAIRHPDERSRVDAVADIVAAACMNLVQEIGK